MLSGNGRGRACAGSGAAGGAAGARKARGVRKGSRGAQRQARPQARDFTAGDSPALTWSTGHTGLTGANTGRARGASSSAPNALLGFRGHGLDFLSQRSVEKEALEPETVPPPLINLSVHAGVAVGRV